MKVDNHSIIRVNNTLWNLVDSTNCIVERLGIRARLIFKTKNSGKMVSTNLQTGRITSKPFIAK